MNPTVDIVEPSAANNFFLSELRTEIINTDGTTTDPELLFISELRKLGWSESEFRECWEALRRRRQHDQSAPRERTLHGLAWRVQTLIWPVK